MKALETSYSRGQLLVTIRLASVVDLPWVLALQRTESNKLGFIPRRAVEAYVEERWTLVADVDGVVCGYVLGRPSLRYARWCRPITQLVVHEAFRGRGLGRALLNGVAESAAVDGRHAIQAWTRADLAASWFFDHLKWVSIATRQTAAKRGHPMVLRRLSLTAVPHASFNDVPPVAGFRAARVPLTAVDAQSRLW